MPPMVFEPTIPFFEWFKNIHASERKGIGTDTND